MLIREEKMDNFVCGKCGYVVFGSAPDNCPVCNAPKNFFQPDSNAIKKPADPKNLNELEKKHTPVIKISKQCGLAGAGCTDAHIKIGEILHPMEEKHFITSIDIYIDNVFISRYHLTAERLNPILGIHLKVSGGKLKALESCNLHGRWMAEADI